MKFKNLNRKLRKHNNATFRSYSENDPYLEALKAYKEANQRRTKTSAMEKLKRKQTQKKLLPPEKI